jgi:hypothetical protein
MINITFYEKYKLSIILILYFITFYFIFSSQPSFLFNKNGTFRDFGAGYTKKTIIPAWFFTILIAISIYLFVNFFIVSLKLYNKKIIN